MKNGKMLLPALLSIALVFSLTLPASATGASTTVPLPDYGSVFHWAVYGSRPPSAMVPNTPEGRVTPMVTVGWGGELARWNPYVSVEEYTLTISSTAGGTVTTPGEGSFTYTLNAVVDLMAQPEEGYRFVNWAGDVHTITDVTAAATNVTVRGNYSITANFVSVEAGNVGVKAGDWIKLEYKITGWPAGAPYAEWLKMEFLSVDETGITSRVTTRMSDGTEQSDTVPMEVGASGGGASGLSGLVISANLTTGDSIYLAGHGDLSIEGETTRTYAGAKRTVVYASISQYEGQLTYCWDKQTGVVVESSLTSDGLILIAKATETNMWKAATTQPPSWVWLIVAVVVAALAIVAYHRKKRKTPTIPTPPTEST